ncbi:hypothetical protein NQZ68_029707 [Dissostichus eleginoides]|nr:hypothetical protein NQZ68_029707 [Dissostichus eleginoides]
MRDQRGGLRETTAGQRVHERPESEGDLVRVQVQVKVWRPEEISGDPLCSWTPLHPAQRPSLYLDSSPPCPETLSVPGLLSTQSPSLDSSPPCPETLSGLLSTLPRDPLCTWTPLLPAQRPSLDSSPPCPETLSVAGLLSSLPRDPLCSWTPLHPAQRPSLYLDSSPPCPETLSGLLSTQSPSLDSSPPCPEPLSGLLSSLPRDPLWTPLHPAGTRGEKALPSGGERPPTEQSYILVLGNADVDPCLLLSLQSHANTDATADATADANAEGQSVCVDPPPQIPDHQYARSSSSHPVAASLTRRQRCRKPPVSSQSSATGGPAPLPCPQCPALLPSAGRLSEHQRRLHPSCPLCGALFRGLLQLREHQSREHLLLPFRCSVCSRSFRTRGQRDRHHRGRHSRGGQPTGEKSNRCEVCGKSFSCVSVLKTHRRSHCARSFVCDVCGKSFFQAGHLTRHQLVHDGGRPHRCSLCGRGFRQAANLRSHEASHRADTQLCSVCGKSFRRLKSHVLRRHPAEKPCSQEAPC